MSRIRMRLGVSLCLLGGALIAGNGTLAGPFGINTTRLDPYKNMRFVVIWDGRPVAGADAAGGLNRTTEVVKHREGGDPSSSHKSPAGGKFEPLTLERGVTHDVEFEKWAASGHGRTAELTIEEHDEAGRVIATYKVHRCWVSEFEAQRGGGAGGQSEAISHLKLQNEGWERD